jgi:hypothetical protein
MNSSRYDFLAKSRRLLNSLASEAKLIQVARMATKHANKSFLSWLGGFFPYLSLWVEGWLWIGWVVGDLPMIVSNSFASLMLFVHLHTI